MYVFATKRLSLFWLLGLVAASLLIFVSCVRVGVSRRRREPKTERETHGRTQIFYVYVSVRTYVHPIWFSKKGAKRHF